MLNSRIEDMLSHAEECERPLELRSYRKGLEDGFSAAAAAWDPDDFDAGGRALGGT